MFAALFGFSLKLLHQPLIDLFGTVFLLTNNLLFFSNNIDFLSQEGQLLFQVELTLIIDNFVFFDPMHDMAHRSKLVGHSLENTSLFDDRFLEEVVRSFALVFLEVNCFSMSLRLASSSRMWSRSCSRLTLWRLISSCFLRMLARPSWDVTYWRSSDWPSSTRSLSSVLPVIKLRSLCLQ